MRNSSFIFAVFSLIFLFSNKSFANCGAGESELIIDITPDAFYLEITWQVNHYLTGNTLLTGNADGGTFCLPNDDCYDFTIFDLAGDGICCEGLQGEYSVYFNDELIITGGEYTSSEYSGSFGCPNGKSCSSALSVQEGFYSTPFAETFYEFTPEISGLYNISTCYSNNTCNTAIWAYDYCQGLPYTNNLEGAIDFGALGCGSDADLAVTQVNFLAGETYYIRIGNLDDCTSSIFWKLEYLAPVTDCTDPEACNYNPFAEISNNNLCEYAGGNENCPGPDFAVDEELLKNSMYIGFYTADATGCYLNEGCVNGAGEREVLRFSTKISNIGEEDFYLGMPNAENPLWTWDECHQHYHFENYAEYILYQNGEPLPIGYKTGFCLEDTQCPGLGDYKFGCNVQGLTKGCADIYSADLPCQWIDITDVEPGLYSLLVRVNYEFAPDSLGRYEQNYNNNWAQVCFELFRDSENEAFFELKENCNLLVDCEGNPYGTATTDCAGNCNGSAIIGDINFDGALNGWDTEALANILYGNNEYAECFDANGNGEIDFYDLALSNNCTTNSNCDFPINLSNSVANIAFGFEQESIIYTSNELAEWATINVHTPDSRINAYELSIENGVIDAYEILIGQSDAQVFFNESKTKVGIVYNSNFIPFTNEATPILKLAITVNDTSETVCINSEIKAISDQMLALSPTINNACFAIDIVSNNSKIDNKSGFNLHFQNEIIVIENLNSALNFDVKLYNLQAQIVQQNKNILGTSTQIVTSNLTSGMYLLELKQNDYIYRKKVIIP